jgi:hypothetical protein
LKQKKSAGIAAGGFFFPHNFLVLLFLHVDIVSDDSAKHAADNAANDSALDLVVTRRRANDGTSSCSDGSITLGVLFYGSSA